MSFGYSVSTAVGRVAAGQTDSLFTPRSPRTGRVGAVLVHGSGAPGEFLDAVAQPSSVALAAGLAGAGIPCISGEFGDQAWANDALVSDIDAAWAALQSLAGVSAAKINLIGVSMGGAGVARYSQANPTKVAAVVGLIPLWDLDAFYAANPGNQAEIAAAWGVATGAALPSRADVATNAYLAAGIPHLAGYSSVDTTVLPAWVTAYTTAVGGTAQITDSTFGHSDQAVGGMPISTVGQFLAANGA